MIPLSTVRNGRLSSRRSPSPPVLPGFRRRCSDKCFLHTPSFLFSKHPTPISAGHFDLAKRKQVAGSLRRPYQICERSALNPRYVCSETTRSCCFGLLKTIKFLQKTVRQVQSATIQNEKYKMKLTKLHKQKQRKT